jgi:2-polyprenyl-6-methoxyphenol hydroxylase-like FAD-dependent oxidoreductase
MTTPLGSHAIVVGAGIGGLAAAAALAPVFGKVTVIDRDELPAGPVPRMAIGQGLHTHQLLKAGEESLERLLPGLTQAFNDAGAIEMRVGRDIDVLDFGGLLPECDAGFSVTSLSRPAYEHTLLVAVRRHANIAFRDQTPVRRFSVKDGVCIGVELEDGSLIPADLVVDATGLTGPLARQLAEDGHAKFETEEIRINVAYTSGRFVRPERYRGENKGFFTLPAAPHNHFGLLLPIENDHFLLSLGRRGGEAPPRDLAAYRDYAKALPTSEVWDRIKDAELVGDLKTFRKPTAHRRKFWETDVYPSRLLPIGDAMSSVNPTYGQGMTVAANQAAGLANLLADRTTLDGLEADYLKRAADYAQRAWSLSTNSDYVYTETEGERPPNFAMSRAIAGVLRQLAEEHEDFRILRYRLVHMMDGEAALREGPLAMRFFAALQGSMAPPN